MMSPSKLIATLVVALLSAGRSGAPTCRGALSVATAPEEAQAGVPVPHSGAKSVPTQGEAQQGFEEPSLDLVDAWLLSRLGRQHCRPEKRLLRALALMRMGAWSSAEKTFASVVRPSADGPELPACAGGPEGWFLKGVLLNFLHRPAEATQALKRARESLRREPLVELELGRAEFEEGNWTAAEESLSAALADHALRPRARYLRARSLMSQGLLEAASSEASELTRCARHKPLPPAVESFVADVRRRVREEGALQAITSVIEQPVPELVQAVAPLRGLDPSAPPPPGGLGTLLKELGATVDSFFRDFSNTAATEVLWQTRLDKNGKAVGSRSEEFYYLLFIRTGQGRWWVEEYRGDRGGHETLAGGLQDGYMATSGFTSGLVVFHPTYQPGMAYRYLGRQKVGDLPAQAGEWAYVVGFAQRPGHSDPLAAFRCRDSGRSAQLYLQGIAWISADQHQVLRMRTDLLEPALQVKLKQEIAEVDYRPYRFASSPRSFWLPSRVRVSVEWGNKRLQNAHNFTQYRLFKVDTSAEIKEPELAGHAPSN